MSLPSINLSVIDSMFEFHISVLVFIRHRYPKPLNSFTVPVRSWLSTIKLFTDQNDVVVRVVNAH